MSIVSFYRVKERSQRIIWFIVIGLIAYWNLGSWLVIQGSYAIYAAFAGAPGSWWLSPSTAGLVCLFSTLTATAHYAWATRSVIRRTLQMFDAQPIDTTDPYHVMLRNTVDEVRIATGNRMPIECVVIPCASLNGLSLRTPQGKGIVGITEGMLARMKRNEVQAVVAQLTGQIITNDALVSTLAYSLFGSLQEMVDQGLESTQRNRHRHGRDGSGGFLVLLLLTKGFVELGKFVNWALSRERMFRSDAVAVELTRDPLGLAQAMRRLGHTWRGSGTFGPGTEAVLFVAPGRGEKDTERGFLSSLFGAQPPLQSRLKRTLAMAGGSLKEVDDLLEKPTAHRATALSAMPTVEYQWKVNQNDRWEGPFTLALLGTMPWIGPATFVCRMGTGQIVTAGEDDMIAAELFGKRPQRGNCPRCGAALTEMHYEGVAGRACCACGGRLVPNDGIQRILTRRVFQVSEPLLAKVATWKKNNCMRPRTARTKDDPQRVDCPLCPEKMVRAPYNAQYFVEVDRCFSCKVTWFDGDELEILQALVEEASAEILEA